jgi:methanethiol S-methyltransferase
MIVAIGGALVFVGSLLFFVASYLWRFEAPPPAAGNALRPIVIDTAIFTAFALHHSLFARSGAKAWIQRIVPAEFERSVYVWIASLGFIAVCAAWQPVPGVFWQLEGWPRHALTALQLVAMSLTVVAARGIGVFHLAGIAQVLSPARARGVTRDPVKLDETGLYGVVRHPIYLGWLFFVWPTPTMNGTRLLFAALSSAYLVLAVPLEERDLRATFGAAYTAYAKRVRWRIIPYLY